MSEVLFTSKTQELDYCRSVGVHEYAPGQTIIVDITFNNESKIFYTVPINKVLLLDSIDFFVYVFADSIGLYVRNMSSSPVYSFIRQWSATPNKPTTDHIRFSHYFEIPSGYDIYGEVLGTNAVAVIDMHGYLVDTV
jgi:hypothetical protein